jgi:hypothetical protein
MKGRRRCEPVCLQAVDWRLRRAWIDSKLGELLPYFDYLNLVSWFEIWVSGASDLRAVLSVQIATVLA